MFLLKRIIFRLHHLIETLSTNDAIFFFFHILIGWFSFAYVALPSITTYVSRTIKFNIFKLDILSVQPISAMKKGLTNNLVRNMLLSFGKYLRECLTRMSPHSEPPTTLGKASVSVRLKFLEVQDEAYL